MAGVAMATLADAANRSSCYATANDLYQYTNQEIFAIP
jgi:hypothetical protein